MTSNDVRRTTAREVWDDTPSGWKGAVVVGVVAWFVAVSDSTVTTVNGAITSCSYLDYAKIGLGALTVLLVITGFTANRRSRRGLATPIAAVVVLALIVDGVLLVLTGVDVVAAVCPV